MAKYVVRYGTMRFLGVFTPCSPRDFPRAAQVIVRTDRGLEAGEVLCEATPRSVGWLKNPIEGQLLRQMTLEDTHEVSRLKDQARNEFLVCRRAIESLTLEMDLIDVEHIFGGERVVVYYLAEGRVDFRQLVKVLAGEFQTRIEMRQIGVRDEAKLLADFGDCGQAVCCNSHLIEMPPVSMKMAKLQKATLDPTKISGRCGRLKCCLRYEFDTYEFLQKLLPPLGTYVVTAAGRAKVIGHEVLSQQLLVETEDRHRTLVDLAQTTAAGEAGPVAVLSPAGEVPAPASDPADADHA